MYRNRKGTAIYKSVTIHETTKTQNTQKRKQNIRNKKANKKNIKKDKHGQ